MFELLLGIGLEPGLREAILRTFRFASAAPEADPQALRARAEAIVAGGGLEAIHALQGQLGAVFERFMDDWYQKVNAALQEGTATWSAKDREPLFAAYLGFPELDAAIYPITRMANRVGGGELEQLNVFRISPADAVRLSTAGARKLQGTELGHFRGFLQRKYRENDFLWGRLNGTERLLTLLGAPQAATYQEAFRQVVAAERRALKTLAPAQWDRLERSIGSLGLPLPDGTQSPQ
jgi:hypothetical protein